MSQPSPPCKLYGEVGLGLLIVAWRYFVWPAQNFCAAAEVFAPQNLWKSRNRLCRRYRYMYLGGYRWANKSVGLRTKHHGHDTEVDHDSTLSGGCGWAAAAPDPVKVRPLQEFYEIIPVAIFQCMGSFVFCPNKPKKRASACENCKAKRSKSVDLCTAMHAPVICMTVRDMPVYMQMNRCQGGKSSRLHLNLCRRTGSFPVVTVTNLFANRSTLNSCNFVVSWRIELKFVALESWRVSFFNNVSFVAKRWGLKNHPRSLPKVCRWGCTGINLPELAESSWTTLPEMPIRTASWVKRRPGQRSVTGTTHHQGDWPRAIAAAVSLHAATVVESLCGPAKLSFSISVSSWAMLRVLASDSSKE